MSTYAQLQTDIVDTLKDSQVDAVKARDFIRRAEYKLQRDLLEQRYGGSVPHQMLVSLAAQTDNDSSYTLPSSFLTQREVYVSGTRARYVAPGTQWHLTAGSTLDTAEADFILHYYRKLEALSDVNTSNWLLDVGYDCYLWSACLQYVPWGHEVEVLPLWRDMYVDALTTIKNNLGAQPRGGFTASKAKAYGTNYTISDGRLWFAASPGVA